MDQEHTKGEVSASVHEHRQFTHVDMRKMHQGPWRCAGVGVVCKRRILMTLQYPFCTDLHENMFTKNIQGEKYLLVFISTAFPLAPHGLFIISTGNSIHSFGCV